MEVTEVRLHPIGGEGMVKAYANIILDDALALHDLKVLDGPRGIFLAMPTRKLTDRCPRCQSKNHLRAKFCNECGATLAIAELRVKTDAVTGRLLLHADVVHPISRSLREHIEERVLTALKRQEITTLKGV